MSPWPNRLRRHWPLVVLLLTLAAAMLRLESLNNALEYDEIWTLEGYAGSSVAAIFQDLGLPNNHPLNSLLVKLMAQFSTAFWWLRFPAWLAGVLTIPAAGWLAWAWFRRRATACWCMLLLTCSAPLAGYAQQARGYSLQFFCCVLFALGLALSGKFRPRCCRPLPEILVFLGGAGGVLTLSTSVLFLAAAVIPAWPAFVRRWRDPRQRRGLWPMLGVLLAGGVLSLGWYCWNFQQFRQAQQWGTVLDSGAALGIWLYEVLTWLEPWPLLLAALAAGLGFRRCRWLLAATLLVLASALIFRAGPPRAYLPLVLPGSLLAAVGIDWLLRRLRANRRLQTALGAVLVLGVFVAFRQGVVQQRNPDWRAWFRSAASLPPGMLTVFPANASQPVAWNSRPESYRDFFRRLSYRGEGERAVVLVGCRGLNGTDRYGGERVQLLPDDGREALQIGALEGYCYRLRELSGPPDEGHAVLALITPAPTAEANRAARLVTGLGGGEWLLLNVWFVAPLQLPQGEFRGYLLGTRWEAGWKWNPDAALTEVPGRIRFYQLE